MQKPADRTKIFSDICPACMIITASSKSLPSLNTSSIYAIRRNENYRVKPMNMMHMPPQCKRWRRIFAFCTSDRPTLSLSPVITTEPVADRHWRHLLPQTTHWLWPPFNVCPLSLILECPVTIQEFPYFLTFGKI